MKVDLYGAHQGIINMMMDVLEDHKVNFINNSVFDEERNFENTSSDVSIITYPYRGLKEIPVEKKVIIYATDPFTNMEDFLMAKKRKNTIIIDDVDGLTVYPKELFPVISKFSIPHTIKPRLPKYIGDIPAVAIVNRKPHERFLECSRGVPLETFLREVNYHVIHVPADNLFFETISHYSGVFYFSNNPYTLAMFELMSMNMPMVAYSGCRYSNNVMEKYLGKTYSDMHLVKKAIDDIIINNKPTVYPLNDFEECKKKWNEAIHYADKL